MSKIYVIILDGAADYKIPELMNRTPLEAANTPGLDNLTKCGIMSMIEILPSQYIPETDSGLMALLGYDPLKYYCGRGTLEAIGLGLYKKYRYFVGFRVNFASYNEESSILERRTARGLSSEELKKLTNEICENVKLDKYPEIDYELVAFGTHRGILSFYSDTIEISGNVTNTDPGFLKQGYFSIPVVNYENTVLPCTPLDSTEASHITANIVNEFLSQSHTVLKKSKVNALRKEKGVLPCNWLILRDGGSSVIPMESFYEKYKRNISIYGELPCEKALANLIKAEFHYSKEFELQLDAKYLCQLADKLLKDSTDIVFCHLKGPDEPGHDRNPEGKVKAIEKIDSCFISRIAMKKEKDDVVVVTCDHSTPCILGVHSNDRVPLLISKESILADGQDHFDEKNAAEGSCPVLKAIDLMQYLTRRMSV